MDRLDLGDGEAALRDWFAVEGVDPDGVERLSVEAASATAPLFSVVGAERALAGLFVAAFTLGWTSCRDREDIA